MSALVSYSAKLLFIANVSLRKIDYIAHEAVVSLAPRKSWKTASPNFCVKKKNLLCHLGRISGKLS